MMTPVPLQADDGVPLNACWHPPAAGAAGRVLLLHGLSADMDESGLYLKLARELTTMGFGVLRFDFRGHGCSGGTPEGMTIAGEMLDALAALRWLATSCPTAGPTYAVAASFGAVPLTLLQASAAARVEAMVLWNPALELDTVFLQPTTAWGRENFGMRIQEQLLQAGHLTMTGGFRLGPVLFHEMSLARPNVALTASQCPVLLVHGDADAIVPHGISARAAARTPGSQLHTVPGADHGFSNLPGGHESVVAATCAWLAHRVPAVRG